MNQYISFLLDCGKKNFFAWPELTTSLTHRHTKNASTSKINCFCCFPRVAVAKIDENKKDVCMCAMLLQQTPACSLQIWSKRDIMSIESVFKIFTSRARTKYFARTCQVFYYHYYNSTIVAVNNKALSNMPFLSSALKLTLVVGFCINITFKMFAQKSR